MSPEIAFNTVLAGLVVAATPGPAVLALIGLGAVRGRRAATSFLVGHFAGDALWAAAALATLASARLLPPLAFTGLALACAAYLGWLGLGAILTRRRDGQPLALALDRPLLRSAVLGLTNPKSYPLAIALLTAALGPSATEIGVAEGAAVVGLYLFGFVLGDIFDIWLVGSRFVIAVYRRHDLAITRGTGLLFLLFAAQTAWDALRQG